VWDERDLSGRWPHQTCADPACNGGGPTNFLPYDYARRRFPRFTADWPETPVRGQTVRLLVGGGAPRRVTPDPTTTSGPSR
jgi:hypothetical protein